MVKTSIEEETGDSNQADKYGASVASASLSGDTSADMEDNTVSSQPIDADAIETLDTEDDEGIKSEENGEIMSEKQPLRGDGDKAGASGSGADNIDEEMGSKDDLDSDSQIAQKKAWDVRCLIVGVLIVLIMVGGATAAILVHKFKAKPTYEFKFAASYGDHMVLQRSPNRAVVWGYGPFIEQQTVVKLLVEGGNSYSKEYTTNTVLGGNGVSTWKYILDEMTDPGPFTLTATLVDHEGHEAVISDVLFGDVWVCAGAGNMQFSVDLLENGTEEIADAENYQDIRLFSVFPATSDLQRYDLREIQLNWSKPNKRSLVGPPSSSDPENQFKMHFSALCWLYGKELHKRLGYPVGLITAVYMDSSINQWVSAKAIESCGDTFDRHSYSRSRLWNAMIHPLLELSIYGVIWDQGETDGLKMPELTGRGYNCTLVKMLSEWRQEAYTRTGNSTQHQFPIGIVQLGANRPGETLTYGSTEVRYQQTANFGFLPNALMEKTFMAVTMDLPDFNSSLGSKYPKHKHIVTQRLLKGAMSEAYRQKNVVYQGPFLGSYRIANRNLVLNFEDGEAIQMRNKNGFEICCSQNQSLHCVYSFTETTYAPGRKWVTTPITDHNDTSITLDLSICHNQDKPHAVGIRYAWRESPCEFQQCAIYGTPSGLPMAPYIRMGLESDGELHQIDKSQIHPI